jgi:RimJ/RimL family protein N-acetyltransferase
MGSAYRHISGIEFNKLDYHHIDKLLAMGHENWPYKHHLMLNSLTDQEEWFNRVKDDLDILIMVASYEGLDVGVYQYGDINWVNKYWTSSHDLFKESKGKGLGKHLLAAGVDFGFEALGMHRCNAEVLATNIASIKNCLYVGMVEEGRKKEVVFRNGIWIDSVVFGLTYTTWWERRANGGNKPVQQ